MLGSSGGAPLLDPEPEPPPNPRFVQVVLSRLETDAERTRLDAVSSVLADPVDTQQPAGPARCEGEGRITLALSTELLGHLTTTNVNDPATGEAYPLAGGVLVDPFRQAIGLAVRTGARVAGAAATNQGAIYVDGAPVPSRITGTATTRAILDSGLSPGDGFLPQDGSGNYSGGLIGQASVLGVDRLERTLADPPIELARSYEALVFESRVYAAYRGAGRLEPGQDGELGTGDDAWTPLRFDPPPIDCAVPTGGTDLREVTNEAVREAS